MVVERLLRNSLDNRILMPRQVSMHPNNPQPSLIKQPPPLINSPLPRPNSRHHQHIHTRSMPVRPPGRHNDLINQHLRRGPHRLPHPRQDRHGLVARPVMQHRPEVIKPRAADGLGIKKIMRHGLHPVQLRRNRKRVRHILEDEASPELRERSRERGALVPEPAADVNKRRGGAVTQKGAQLRPEGEHGEPGDAGLRRDGHGLLEGLPLPGVRPQPLEPRHLCREGLPRGGVGHLLHVAVARRGEDLREGLQQVADRVGGVVDEPAVLWPGECLGGLVCRKGVLAGFLDLVNRCEIS